jgi:hypothetical protein
MLILDVAALLDVHPLPVIEMQHFFKQAPYQLLREPHQYAVASVVVDMTVPYARPASLRGLAPRCALH